MPPTMFRDLVGDIVYGDDPIEQDDRDKDQQAQGKAADKHRHHPGARDRGYDSTPFAASGFTPYAGNVPSEPLDTTVI